MAEANDMSNIGAQPQTSPLAIVSLVLGIFSIPSSCLLSCFGALAGILAVIFGHMARSSFKREPGKYSGDGLATAGLILGYISIALGVLSLAAIVVFLLIGTAHHSGPLSAMLQAFSP